MKLLQRIFLGAILILASIHRANAQGVTVTFANSIPNNTSVTGCASSTAECVLQVVTLPPGALNGVNRTILVIASGTWTTAAAQTPTITTRVKLSTLAACTGGTTITIASGTSAASTASITAPWHALAVISTSAAGASGTVWGNGITMNALVSATSLTDVRETQATAVSSAIDLTAQLFICSAGVLSSSNASNNMKGLQIYAVPLNFSF